MTSTSTAVEQFSGQVDITESQMAMLEREARIVASLAPGDLRGKVTECLAIGLTARALQMPLTVATLSQFHVIKGRVEPSAQLHIAMAHARGHHVWIEERTDQQATVAIRRKGQQQVHRFTFTLDDARRAGLLDKDNWRQYPKDMLVARAAKRAVKWAAPDAAFGLPSIEIPEDDVIEVDDPEVASAPPGPVDEATGGPDPQAADDWDRQALASRIDDLDEEWRAVARQRWMAAPLPAPSSEGLTKAHVEAAADLLGTIEAEAAESYDRRRKWANAVMGEVGIRSDKARHSCVRQATEGRTESTARLSSVDLEAVVAACEAMKADEAPPHDEEGEDDPGAPFE